MVEHMVPYQGAYGSKAVAGGRHVQNNVTTHNPIRLGCSERAVGIESEAEGQWRHRNRSWRAVNHVLVEKVRPRIDTVTRAL